MGGIYNALIVGRSSNYDHRVEGASPHGIITPRSDGYTVKGIRFYNFDWRNASAIGTCSHCHMASSTDSGARTVRLSGLWFDSTVPRRIRYRTPFKAILYDLDGSLTGIGPKTWATPYYKHHEVPECKVSMFIHDGVICDSTVQVRRVVFHDPLPAELEGQPMKVLLYSDWKL